MQNEDFPSLVTPSDTAATLPRSDSHEIIGQLKHARDNWNIGGDAIFEKALSTIERLEQEVVNVRGNEQTHKEYAHMMQEQRTQIADHCKILEGKLNTARAAIDLGQENCDAAYEDLRKERDMAREQRDELQAITERLYGDIALLRQPKQEIPEAGLRRPTVTETHAASEIEAVIEMLALDSAKACSNLFKALPKNVAIGIASTRIANAMREIVSLDAHADLQEGVEKLSAVVTQSPEQAEAEDEAAWAKLCGKPQEYFVCKKSFLAGRRSRGES